MKRRLVFFLILISASVNGQDVLRQFALFEYNSYELTTESKSMIDEMLTEIGSDTITKIELYGHTDNDGAESANLLLSQNRVLTVQVYLLSKGIKPSTIITNHYGESKPSYSNESESGMQKNRRVEIAMTQRPSTTKRADPITLVTTPAKTQPKTIHSLPTTNTDVQSFKESTRNKIDIIGSHGTHIIFSENCFVDHDGKSVSGEVTIEIVEVYTQAEMINHNLSTVSNGALIESAGMAYIRIIDDGSQVSLAPYVQYTIEFPATDKIAGMQLFYGDTSSGTLNWQAQSMGKGKGGDWDYVNQQTLDHYVFTTSKLGWINCDHFLTGYDVFNMFVETADTTGVSFCLVFKEHNAIMNPKSKENGIEFANVPIGEMVTVIAFRKTETGSLYGSEPFRIQNHSRPTVVMTALTEAEFQLKIQEFN